MDSPFVPGKQSRGDCLSGIFENYVKMLKFPSADYNCVLTLYSPFQNNSISMFPTTYWMWWQLEFEAVHLFWTNWLNDGDDALFLRCGFAKKILMILGVYFFAMVPRWHIALMNTMNSLHSGEHMNIPQKQGKNFANNINIKSSLTTVKH